MAKQFALHDWLIARFRLRAQNDDSTRIFLRKSDRRIENRHPFFRFSAHTEMQDQVHLQCPEIRGSGTLCGTVVIPHVLQRASHIRHWHMHPGQCREQLLLGGHG
ncbi:MAG: hypothetical protein LR015_00240 [Verrucomicrobia bacterium]|nr:hypothetical protein [Verrucomicrobiota bacterium]